MAKKVFMIAPFDAMSGNLSGAQKLQYAQNNNPAYEAPNGTQYARNYHTRYIGARRGRDGLTYFQVKKTTATVLNADTRLTMGTLAAVAAIRSALMKDHASDYAQIIANLIAEVTQGIMSGTGKRTVMSLFYEKVAAMLKSHDDRVTFSGSTPVVVANPWYSLQPASTISLTINQALWVKYAPLFWVDDNVIGGVHFRINGALYFANYIEYGQTTLPNWAGYATQASTFTAPNYDAMVTGITEDPDTGAALLNGNEIKLAGVTQEGADDIIANAKYTA